MLDKETLEQLCNAVDAALASRGLAGARVTGRTVTPYEIRLSVSVPRSDILPVKLAPLLRGLRNVPPVTAVLGVADDGVPLPIRLSSPEVRHILVAGPAGCGKSALLRTVAISTSYFTPAWEWPYPPPRRTWAAWSRRAGGGRPGHRSRPKQPALFPGMFGEESPRGRCGRIKNTKQWVGQVAQEE